MDGTKDYYRVLGVDKKASDSDIKKKYRDLAKKFHPDKHKGDEKATDKFKEISEAYDVLGDKEKRQEYDMQRENPFSRFSGNGANSQNFRGFNQGDGNFDGFGDIFSSFFGGNASGRPRQKNRQSTTTNKNNIVEETIRVPIRLAVNGGEYLFKNPKGQTVKLKIPSDCQRFHKIKLKEQGRNSEDLIVTIDFSTGSDVYLEGSNVIQKIKIPVWDAVLGNKREVLLYNDKKVNITIKEGSNSHQRLKLNGMGLKTKDAHGDCFLELVLECPKNLTKLQKDTLMSMRYNTF